MASSNQNNTQINNNQPQRWHLGKEIPISIIFALLVQTGGGIWWAATLTNKFDNILLEISSIKSERYTKSDSEKDLLIIKYKLDDLKDRIENIENK